MDEPDPQRDAHAMSMILIAELHRIGMFDHGNLASIARRLELAGEDDAAQRVRALPLSNALTDPEAMRASIYSISGGKESEE
jgi:hypothetical protein